MSPNVAQTVPEAHRQSPTSFILSGLTPVHSESDQTSSGIERWSLPVSQTSNESFTSREQCGTIDELQAKGSLPSIGTESDTATREEQVVTKTPHDRESVQNRMCPSNVHLEEVTDRQDLPSAGSAFAVEGECRAQESLTAVETQTTINSVDAKQSPASLERAPSKVRLSMASDGSAKVVTGDESSPSPPRSQPVPPMPIMSTKSLRRSYSAAGLNDVSSPNESESSYRGLRRAPSGRSRDSRAWEFWCDGDAGNDLAKKADQEQSGSAADAISCMRSSSRGTLTPNINKTNVMLSRQSSAKRVKNDYLLNSRPELGRAEASVARLQGGAQDVGPVYIIEDEAHKDQSRKPSIAGVDVSSGDSDKENREPETQNLSNIRRTATQSQVTGCTRRPILGDNRTVTKQNSSCGSPRRERGEESKKRPVRNLGLKRERLDPEDDEELATFMSGCRNDGEHASLSAEDDLDCIQGLLSLSQGNWK